MKRFFLVVALLCLYAQPTLAADSPIKRILPTAEQSTLACAGSDTMRVLVLEWQKAFTAENPGTASSMEARGSATALPALLAGKCNLAAMSRPISKAEAERFEAEFGYKPVGIKVALDALAVYVHPDNPLRGLTLRQLDGIFSSSRVCGGDSLVDWGALVFGSFEGHDIVPEGRDTLSGTYELFRELALCGGTFRDNVRAESDSSQIIAKIAANPYAIGYAGIGYRTKEVRALSIARNENSGYFKYYVDEFENDPDLNKRYAYVYRGKYPLSRALYIYVNKAPGRTLPPHLERFLCFVLSDKGQDIVHSVGFIPLTSQMTADERRKLLADYSPSWWSL